MSDEFVFEDGRKAEKIEIDQGKTKVTEIYVEPKPEKKLAQRITEKYCVCERLIETLDEITGEVVGSVVEQVSNGEVLSSDSVSKSSVEELVEEKINNSKSKISIASIVLISIIVAQVVGLVYLLLGR
jgi:hypothetical protein